MMNQPNPFSQPQAQWTVQFDVPLAIVEAVEQAFADIAVAVMSFELEEAAARWQVQLICHAEPERQEIAQRMAVVEAMTGHAVSSPVITPLEQKDWLREVEKGFPPIEVGRFFVYGSHYQEALPPGKIPLQVNAGAAFGSGEHATTSGCLEALEGLMHSRNFTRMLDMGCGTAILAMAMAKLSQCRVLAVDIDPVSVKVAQENCRRNRVDGLVRAAVSDGYRNALLARYGSYDLIVANILARPLMALARDLKRHLAPGGVAVLSGLLASQEAMVLSAHRTQGLYLKRRIARGGWHTLVISR